VKKLVSIAAALCLSLVASPASGTAIDGPPDGWGSENVEYVKLVSDEQLHGIGARKVGHYLYVTSVKTITIYDVAKPEEPVLVSRTNLGVVWENEDVATNGEILVIAVTRPTNVLRVFNVEDKSAPTEIATLDGAASHTMECLFDCKWLYGSTGLIVDLRDPTAPKLLDEKWTDGTKLDPGYPSHDLIELRPGVLLTSSNPMLLLDARKDVRHPKILAQGDPGDSSFIHSAMWPRGGRDRIMMSAGETNATPRCELGSAAFLTWDASNYKRTRSFQVIDSYTLTNGTATDGRPPVNGMGCSTHWFQHNPKFHNGGIMALGAYDHGTRFLHVDPAGKIEEVGYFLPTASETSAAHWVTDRIVYSIDYSRGIDILKYTGPLK
jgi:hypothetical protein